jgi:quercetin dioxygenase-like cupin family protein
MKRIWIAGVLMLGLSLAYVQPVSAQDAPKPIIKQMFLHNEPVSGVPDREAFMALVEFPPGSSTGRHIHPGDEYATVLSGELQLNVQGQPPRLVKAGDSYHNLQGVVHETRNVGTVPARTIATFIVEKGKPLTQPVK